ncbi:Nicotinate-nucleotide--dimethylbenzimidazole phosphoribosyltransferase [Metalysinibacillus saudimassiliensis]|uniref:Nicotinate-nucleotide--dimethylbenzimidazole phosphoribosyltransferase n=1 Tax=Metalysinibacillus saudimassiliensis TaxID=1461583 RepID=A0A078M523_9BACL|nr:Nicotinate-nucleotide--dimethylbenzimidazole phosphoribosyltransferase [Metalysinibacillus saudimassiliensis]
MEKHFLQTVTIPPLDNEVGQQVADYLDSLTKPRGSLGRLEEIAIELGRMTSKKLPTVSRPGAIVFASDHGITAQGVSPYPSAVTVQMAASFLREQATMSIFCRLIGAELRIVDLGINAELNEEGLINRKVRAQGTRNFYNENAMTEEEALQALAVGFEEATKLLETGVDCLILGELGIGNTSPSSAMMAVLSGKDISEVAGPGSGLVDEQVEKKRCTLREAIERRGATANDVLVLLQQVGGFDIAGMAGAMIAAASKRTPILVDGFISTVAAVVAERLAPGTKNYMLAGHQSAEPGHIVALEMLGKKPIVQLGMRLGEGTGAAVAFPIVKAAIAALSELPTFASAGISDKA